MGKNIYLIVAPSGTGKTTLVEKLAKDHGLKQVESYCTRQPRYPGETSHIFISDEEFDALKEKMVAYTEYVGHRSGVTEDIVNTHDLYVIDPFGVQYFQERYKGPKGVKVIGLTASYDERYARMKKRGDSTEAIRKRLEDDVEAFDFRKYPIRFDFQLHADGIVETAQAVWEYISYHEKYDYDLRIYQINPKRDTEPVMFGDTAFLSMRQGGAKNVQINLGIYDLAWEGDMTVSGLDEVFMYFNCDDRPNAKSMRSLSCSDLVEIKHNENLDLNGLWFCDAIGWKKVEGGVIKLT